MRCFPIAEVISIWVSQLAKGHLIDYLLVFRSNLRFCLHGWQTVPGRPEVSGLTQLGGLHHLEGHVFGRGGASRGTFLRGGCMALNGAIAVEGVRGEAEVAPLLVGHLRRGFSQSEVVHMVGFLGVASRGREGLGLGQVLPVFPDHLFVALLEHLKLLGPKLLKTCPDMLSILLHLLVKRQLLLHELLILLIQRLVHQELLNRLQLHQTKPLPRVTAPTTSPRNGGTRDIGWESRLLFLLLVRGYACLGQSFGLVENVVQILTITCFVVLLLLFNGILP